MKKKAYYKENQIYIYCLEDGKYFLIARNKLN